MFLNSLKAIETNKVYPIYFAKYVEYLDTLAQKNANLKQEDLQILFCGNDPRTTELTVIDFIVSLKEKGMSFSGVKNYVTAIMSFYKINDRTSGKWSYITHNYDVHR
jgi:hypothetical protein